MLIYNKTFISSIISSYANRIKEIYYINVDSEKERNINFLENYNKHSLGIPIHRISGIVPKAPNGRLSKGELGCALSHMKVLDEISKKPWGWYLVCEDDCSGDFRLIKKNVETFIKLHPFINHINLFTVKAILPIIGTGACTTAYLTTPFGAKLSYKIIEKNLEKTPCDISLANSFIHHIIGVHFNKILYPDESPSTIGKINKD